METEQQIELEEDQKHNQEKANQLFLKGEYQEALDLLNKYFSYKTTIGEFSQTEKHEILMEMGRNHQKLCEFEKAKECFQLVLEEKQKSENALDMLAVLNCIGNIEIYLAQYPAALQKLETCKQLAEIYKDYPEYNEIMSGICESFALLSKEKGEFSDALTFIEEAIEFTQENDKTSLIRQYCMRGEIYMDTSKIKKASEDLAKSLEMSVTQKGTTSHPDMIEILNSFALLNSINGKYKEGKIFIDRAIGLSEQFFPKKDHLQKARAYLSLGLYYKKFNQYDEAIKEIEIARNMYRNILGNEHPQVTISTNYLCTIFYEQGEYSKAKEGLLEALEINKRILGEKHPSIGDTYRRIGCCHKEEGKYNEAFDYFKRSLNIFLDVFGSLHETLASSYSDIGTIYYRLDDQHQALKNYKKALEVSYRLFGEDHPNVAREYHNLGMVYGDLGNKNLEVKYYKKALKIEKAIFGKNHTNIADTYQNLGVVYGEMGMLDKALKKQEQSLQIRLYVFGNKHHSVSSSYYGLGYIYAEKKDYYKAMQFFGKSLNLREEFYGRCHMKTANCCQSIGFLYDQVKALGDSKKCFLKSYQAKKRQACQNKASLQSLGRTIEYLDRDIAVSEKNWPESIF